MDRQCIPEYTEARINATYRYGGEGGYQWGGDKGRVRRHRRSTSTSTTNTGNHTTRGRYIQTKQPLSVSLTWTVNEIGRKYDLG